MKISQALFTILFMLSWLGEMRHGVKNFINRRIRMSREFWVEADINIIIVGIDVKRSRFWRWRNLREAEAAETCKICWGMNF